MSHVPITVLMTVYNGGAYLPLAVDSVLKQSFNDFELLIIDDCSTDGAIDSLAKFNDPRIRIHRNAKNLGQTASLNEGLSLARGQIVARMDADDIAFPQWLAAGYAFLSSHPNVMVVSSQAVVIDDKGKVFKKLYAPRIFQEMLLRSLVKSPINHVGSLIRRDNAISLGGYDIKYRIAADFALWSTMIRANQQIAIINDVNIAIRSHRESVTASNKGRADVPEVTDIMSKNIEYFSKKTLSKEEIEEIWVAAYTPELLPANRFLAVSNLFYQLYDSFNASNIVDPQMIMHYVRRELRLLFVKQCFALASNRQYEAMKILWQQGLKYFGYFSLIGILYFLTARGALVSLLHKLYIQSSSFLACCVSRRLKYD